MLKERGKKVIRVLEVGCGTGMLTQFLVDVLPEFPDLVVEYVASDISLGLAMQAANRFSHPYMRAVGYDLTKSLKEQGIDAASFDIVTALHVLHATTDLSLTMDAISELLVPGGYVLTVEFDGTAWETHVPGTIWYDFIFGGFQEWSVILYHAITASELTFFSCRFDFGEDRTAHCTVSLGRWRQLLQGSGFNCTQFSLSHPEEDHSLVFLAQKAGHEQIAPVVECSTVLSDCASDATVYHTSPESLSKSVSPQIAIQDISCLSLHIFDFVRGQEMRLRDELAALDLSESSSIWIIATDGQDGEAARGLTRTLAKEFTAWKIHLAIFDVLWSQASRVAAITKLQENSFAEGEVKIDVNGAVHVPRVVPLPSPVLEAAFDSEKTWMSVDGKIVHTTLPPLGSFDVVVEVKHWSSLDSSPPKAFMGTISNKGTSDFSEDDWVMGLTDGPVCNRLVALSGSLVSCRAQDARLLADCPGLVVAVLAIGPGTLKRSGRLAALQHVLVTDVHTPMGQAAARMMVCLGLDVFCIGQGVADDLANALQIPIGRISVESNAHWVARQRCLYDLVLSGARGKADVQVVSRLTTQRGILYLWNNENQGLAETLKRDPWYIAHALEVAVQSVSAGYEARSTSVSIADAVPVPKGTLVSDQSPLFDPHKAYLLIGGIGGMGIQIAQWMYEVRDRYFH